jgi:hypothetical protein
MTKLLRLGRDNIFHYEFLTVRLGLVGLHQQPLQAQRIKEKHETIMVKLAAL